MLAIKNTDVNGSFVETMDYLLQVNNLQTFVLGNMPQP